MPKRWAKVQEELPLEFVPHPGYWRVTITYKWGRPPETTWFDYDQKHIAEAWASDRPERPYVSEMVLDKDYDPSAFEEDDDNEDDFEYGDFF